MDNHGNAIIGMILGTVIGAVAAVLAFAFTRNTIFLSLIGFATAIGVGIGTYKDIRQYKDLG